jgi:hypothetical protein
MPCIFCIAVFAMLAGAVTTTVLDQLEARLAAEARTPVRRTVDSTSAAKFEFDFPAPPLAGRRHSPAVPVALTVYKQSRRVRIQVLTHDLQRAEVEALEDRIAGIAGLRIVGRSGPEGERKVREAVDAESRSRSAPVVNPPWQASWPQGQR